MKVDRYDVIERMRDTLCAELGMRPRDEAARVMMARALGKAITVAADNGFYLLPIAATNEMCRAGAECFGGKGDDVDAQYEVSVMWKAMFAQGVGFAKASADG